MEGTSTRQSMLSREQHGPRAILNAVERLAGAYGFECDRVQQDLAIAQSQLRDYQARLGKPFRHDAVLSELTSSRDKLNACLFGARIGVAPETTEGRQGVRCGEHGVHREGKAHVQRNLVGAAHGSATNCVVRRNRDLGGRYAK